MTILVARIAPTRCISLQHVLRTSHVAAMRSASFPSSRRQLSSSTPRRRSNSEQKPNNSNDPRINDLGRAISDDFATIRENYGMSVWRGRKASEKRKGADV